MTGLVVGFEVDAGGGCDTTGSSSFAFLIGTPSSAAVGFAACGTLETAVVVAEALLTSADP